MTDDLSGTFTGLAPEDAQVCTALLVGGEYGDFSGLSSFDRARLGRFLQIMVALKIPLSEDLGQYADIDFNKIPPDGGLKPFKAINIREAHGGVNFFEFNPGNTSPDALIISAIPREPINTENLGNRFDADDKDFMAAQFAHSHDYHHGEDDWYNWRQKISEIKPKFVFLSGGDDCMTYQELMGNDPAMSDYVALTGAGVLENGLLVSKAYLDQVGAYLLMSDSPLLKCFAKNGYHAVSSGLNLRNV